MGAGLQGLHPVIDIVLGAHHNDRKLGSHRNDLLEDLFSVEFWQTEVEQNQVDIASHCQGQAAGPVGGFADRVPLGFETPAQHGAHAGFIVDDKHAWHGSHRATQGGLEGRTGHPSSPIRKTASQDSGSA